MPFNRCKSANDSKNWNRLRTRGGKCKCVQIYTSWNKRYFFFGSSKILSHMGLNNVSGYNYFIRPRHHAASKMRAIITMTRRYPFCFLAGQIGDPGGNTTSCVDNLYLFVLNELA